MKRYIIFLLLVALTMPLFSQNTSIIVPEGNRGYRRGLDGFYKWLSNPRFRDVELGTSVLDSLGRTLIYVQNKNGSSLSAGDVCVWDNTAIAVAGYQDLDADSAVSITNDLTDEGGYLSLSCIVAGTPDAGDSVYVYGTTYEDGSGASIITLMPASASPTFMVYDHANSRIPHFSDVDSIKFNTDAYAGGADSTTMYAYPVAGVVASSGTRQDLAGVAVQTITDNSFGYIAIRGAVNVTVDAATTAASPGALLDVSTGGDLVTSGNAATTQAVARAMEYSTSDNRKINAYLEGGGPNVFSALTCSGDFEVDGNADLDGTLEVASNISTDGSIIIEGATADDYEITLDVIDPTADRTLTFPNYTGSIPVIVAQGSTQTVADTIETVDVANSGLAIADSMLAVGYAIKWTMAGTCTGANGTKDVILNIDGAAIVTLTMAQSDQGDWAAEFTMYQVASYNSQDAFGVLNQDEEPIQMDYATDSTDFGDGSPTTVKCQVALTHADDEITVEYYLVEIWKR